MSRRGHAAILFMVVVISFGFLVRNSFAVPYLPPDIAVGNPFSGIFSYNLAENPPDTVPDNPFDPIVGRYSFSGAGNGMSITVGAYTFSSTPHAIVQVTDGQIPGNSDFIQIFSAGDETTFSPFLSGFTNQNPTLSPVGEIGLTFHFPHTYLTDDTLPTSIDPLATAGPLPGSSFPNILGGVAGLSTQLPNSRIREWSFFFDVSPSNMTITSNEGLVQGVFNGVIAGVADDVNKVAVPEPSSLLLLASSLVGLFAWRRKRAA